MRLSILRQLFAIFAVLMVSGCSQPMTTIEITNSIFGTTYSVQVISNNAIDKDDLAQKIHARLEQIDRIMSNWKADSDLSLFNQLTDSDWFSVPEELGLIVKLSKEIHRKTNGTFDPTLGPLIKIWGFAGSKTSNIPSEEAIQVARSRIGMNAVEVSEDNKQMRKTKNVIINLSAIAKGYAVDQIAQLLRTYSIDNFLVEIGGEIRVQGSKYDKPWKLGIEKPDPTNRDLQITINATDIAMATSGDYRNYFTKKNKRYSHIIDPRTGYPVDHDLVSVTVLAKDSATADAYATAFMVLGEEQALAIAENEQLAVYLLTDNGNGSFNVSHSTLFALYITP